MDNFSNNLGIKNIIIFFILSFIFALYGLSFSYHREITPRTSEGEFKDIGGDGWITSNSKMEFKNLSSNGNKIELKFNPWRPDGATPMMIVKVCGEKIGEFAVVDDKPKKMPLIGSCEPKVVEFNVLNPMRAGNNDSRQIGAQLYSVKITSKVFATIVEKKFIIITTILIFLLSLVTYYAFFNHFSVYLAVISPLVCFLLLSNIDNFELRKMYSFFTICFWSFLGVALSRISFHHKKYSYVNDNSSFNVNIFYSIVIFVIIGVGVAIRLWNIDFGLPLNFHPDEVPKVNAIERMYAKLVQGRPNPFDPEYFLHPSMLLYSTYLMGAIVRFFNPTGDFREMTCLAGRFVSCLGGTASIYLTYYIARRLFTPMVGIISASFLAFSPLHITCSRYLKEDALLVFFFLACVAFLIKSVQENEIKYYFISSIMAGFACATKYTGILSVIVVCSAPWLRSASFFPDKRFLKWMFVVLLFIPLTFIAITPYSIINSQKFLEDFESERVHAAKGHTVVITASSEYWTYHFRESILPNFKYLFTALTLLGFGFLVKRKRIEDLYLITLILLFYIPIEYVKSKPAPQPERYILPCIPFLAIAGAEFIRILSLSKYRCLSILLFVLALFFPLKASINYAKEITPDTRELMASWIEKNIPKGSTICIDWKRYGPYLNEKDYNIKYILRAKIIPKLYVPSLKESEYDYLVLSSLFYDRYFSQPANKALRQRFRDVFRDIPIVKEIRSKEGTNAFHNPTLTIFSLKKDDVKAHEEQLKLVRQGSEKYTDNEKKSNFFSKIWRKW